MKWSIMKSRMFSRCQRKWFYYELVASSRSKNPMRREAHILKQLQSIEAWRGSLVDTVIHRFITPRLRSHILPKEDEVLDYALKLMDAQIYFGKNQKYRHPTMRKTYAGDNYCAFYDLEYNGGLKEESLKVAEKDIVSALKNLLKSNFLRNITKYNSYIISQRSFVFNPFEDVSVVCVPDMVVFYENNPPMIIDWKVHTFGNTNAWLQLGIYSLALTKINPHKDFPVNFLEHVGDITKLRLFEYQLLKNKLRQYSVNNEDVLDIEDYIYRSFMQMKRLLDGKKFSDLDFYQFQTAITPNICERCQFKKLCWSEQLTRSSKPVQQLLFGVSLK